MWGKFSLALVSMAALFALLTILANASGAQTSAVYTFECKGSPLQGTGPCPEGGRPDTLILGSDGNFYGAAQDSAEGSSTPTGGTVFSVTPTGTFKLLHTFFPGTNKNYPNGNLPGQITEGPDGKLYGVTGFGGVGGCNGYCGSGVLYRVNKDGTGFQIIHKSCSQTNCADGGGGAMVAAPDGNLYGVSSTGGTGNYGTIFRITPSTGAYKVVFNFDLSTNGGLPSSLILAPDGSFYGLDTGAGTAGESLFHYIPGSESFSSVSLHFPLVNGLPSAGGFLTFGPDGNFYGIYHVYAESGLGVFEVQADGSHLQLFPFYTTENGGGSPQGMLLASDGNFWVANYNGTSGYGSIVTLAPSNGQLTQTIAPFSASSSVGAYPSGLIQAKDGTLWGTTYGYGKSTPQHFADGTVFSLNAGLPPR